MGNPSHLKILQNGAAAWNAWRKSNSLITPDISNSDLSTIVDLQKFELADTNLSFARLFGLNLSGAKLDQANLTHAGLSNVNFTEADLLGVDFSGAFLDEACLKKASILGADFTEAYLKGTDFDQANAGRTIFNVTDLTETKNLETICHICSSTIDFDTLYISRGRIPDNFLRGIGVPEDAIQHFLPLVRVGPPIQWHSCFISYSTKNDAFANYLHSRMRQAGLRVWFAPEDMKGGDYFSEQIERAIQLHERLLLVLSEDSIQSKWVEREIHKARKIERAEKRKKLFPITLMDYDELKKWECLDSDTGEDLAEEIRKFHIPDFSNWRNHDDFEKAFTRLEKDLRTSTSNKNS